MSKRINMRVGASANGGAGVGLMTSAGNPWTVADGLADELVNRRSADYTDAPQKASLPVQYNPNTGAIEDPSGSPLSVGGNPNVNVAIVNSVKPSSLARSKAKKAAVAAGVDSMVILMIGDSTFSGSYGGGASSFTAARPYCMAQQLANVLNRPGRTATSENWFGDSGAKDLGVTLTSYNPLVSVDAGNGWAIDAATTTLGGRPMKCTTASVSLTYKGWGDVNTYEIYYRTQAGGGSFSISRAGDAGMGPISTAGAEGVQKVVFTGALGAALLSIDHDATTNPVTILGIDAYNSGVAQIRLLHAGYAGSKVAAWADGSQPYSARSMIAKVQPDLVIMQPLINDCAQATAIGNAATPGTFLGDLHLLIMACKAAGSDVLLSSGFPLYTNSSANATRTKQKAYVDGLQQLALADGVLYQDTWTKWGLQEANPGWYYNALHPNGVGYREHAETLAAIFESI